VLLGLPKSAICVQRFDDSLNATYHITYRDLLRSSSLREPRYPLLRVIVLFYVDLKINVWLTAPRHRRQRKTANSQNEGDVVCR
jgi:hypothetical protein